MFVLHRLHHLRKLNSLSQPRRYFKSHSLQPEWQEIRHLFFKHGKSDYIGEQITQMAHAHQSFWLAVKDTPRTTPRTTPRNANETAGFIDIEKKRLEKESEGFVPLPVFSKVNGQTLDVFSNQQKRRSFLVAAFLHDIGELVGIEQKSRGDYYGKLAHEHIGANYLKTLNFPPSVYELVRLHVLAKRYLITTDPNYVVSEASKQTFQRQGGFMSSEQVQRFKQNMYFEDAVKLRRLDDKAKEPQNCSLFDFDQSLLLCSVYSHRLIETRLRIRE
jgi:predicted HD phosphohydrolase